MELFWGLLFSAFAALGSWILVAPATMNLPGPLRAATLLGISAVAMITAFLGGVAIARRAATRSGYPRQFMTITLVVVGALIVGVAAAAITLAYLLAFGTWPVGVVGDVLYVLATPLLGVSGAVVGGLFGLLCALVAGTILRIVSPGWR